MASADDGTLVNRSSDRMDDPGLRLARFASDTRVGELPGQVIAKIKHLLIDTVGVALGGTRERHARQALAVALAAESGPQATIMGSPRKASVQEAAFANGVAAHSIDFDDTHKFVHPGCAVVPAVLAMAEHRQASGADTLAALIAGYEISIRVAFAAGVAHRKRGYHPTGTCNVFGSAAGAARVMGLGADDTASAIGAASSMASGLTQYRFDGAANKHLHGGLAARSGVLSALLAEQGFHGTSHALDGEQGYLPIYSDGGDLRALTGELGQRFDVLDTDIKPYPSCRQSHSPVDLALDAALKHGLTAADVERLTIYIYTYADKPWYTANAVPNTPLEAMLCIPYCVASAILHKRLGLAEFSAEHLNDPSLKDLISRITVVGDSALDTNWPTERGARLECMKSTGEKLVLETKNPRGGSDQPFSYEDLVVKFRGLADGVIAKPRQDDFLSAVEDLDTAANCNQLMATLRQPA